MAALYTIYLLSTTSRHKGAIARHFRTGPNTFSQEWQTTVRAGGEHCRGRRTGQTLAGSLRSSRLSQDRDFLFFWPIP